MRWVHKNSYALRPPCALARLCASPSRFWWWRLLLNYSFATSRTPYSQSLRTVSVRPSLHPPPSHTSQDTTRRKKIFTETWVANRVEFSRCECSRGNFVWRIFCSRGYKGFDWGFHILFGVGGLDLFPVLPIFCTIQPQFCDYKHECWKICIVYI